MGDAKTTLLALPERKPYKRAAYRSASFSATDSLMRYADFLGYGDIHIKIDAETGLKAIVAIHNLNRGPAIGGCRVALYPTMDKALEDALRLGYMMSYKAAINHLPHGGAKAVLLRPRVIKDYQAYFAKFGEFLNELGGRYITAIDSGTSPLEMDLIATRTQHVTCTSQSKSAGNPAPLTAYGVRRGIEAAVKFKLKRDDLVGLHIAIQGAGHVGYYLAKDLVALGVRVTMTDVNETSLQRAVEDLGVATCLPHEILELPADVLAPCALGAILNVKTIAKLQVKIVAGAANNQLSHHQHGALLHERGILYAPDFLINAGGLIQVATIHAHSDTETARTRIHQIYDTATDIFEQAAQANCATNIIAEKIAKSRLYNI